MVARFDASMLEGGAYETRDLSDARSKASRNEVHVQIFDRCALVLIAVVRAPGQTGPTADRDAAASDEVGIRAVHVCMALTARPAVLLCMLRNLFQLATTSLPS